MSASNPLGPAPSDYARRIQDELKTRCVYLKTKEAFLGLPSHGREEGQFDTTIWWCEQTCAALGPDGSAATRVPCSRPGRTCYEAPRRPKA